MVAVQGVFLTHRTRRVFCSEQDTLLFFTLSSQANLVKGFHSVPVLAYEKSYFATLATP